MDVTAEAGIVDPDGRGLGVVAADLDDDGKTDLFVANDSSANYFFRNRGGLRFVEEGVASGLATSATGGYLAGMGVACGDYDGDGRLDLAVTNFFGESTTLYHNHGQGLFSDRSAAARPRCADPLGAWLRARRARRQQRRAPRPGAGQRPRRRLRRRNPRTQCPRSSSSVTRRAGSLTSQTAPAHLARPPPGRGLAAGDLDNDGRVDLVLVGENAPLALLHNRFESRDHPEVASLNHFLTLALEGTSSNRDAVGARVAVTVAGRTQIAARFGGGSYLSASDPRLHFGLGPATKADRVEVAWPSGRRDCYLDLAADSGYRLIEGSREPKPMAGFSSRTTQRSRAWGPAPKVR